MTDSLRNLRAELQRADWKALLPRLAKYAAGRLRRLGWARGHDHEPSAMSIEELLNTSLERCLDGSRTWNDDDPPELEVFLRWVIKSVAYSERKKWLGKKTSALEDAGSFDPDPGPLPDAALEEEETREALAKDLEEIIAGDEDLGMLVLAVQDGHLRRSDIAEALGWTPDRVTAARLKLQRALIRHRPDQFATHKKTRGAS